MAATAPLPTIRDASRGPADLQQRLPSLTELFPDNWQPEKASSSSHQFLNGARGPRDFPGPPSIAPSPILSTRARPNFSPAQAPPSLSPSSQQHSPALSGRTVPMLPPMQSSERGLPSLYRPNPNSTPPQVIREMESRPFPPGPAGGPQAVQPPAPPSAQAGGHPSYYPPRDFGTPMAPPPPPPPGYPGGAPGGYPTQMFNDVGDYGDSRKQGRRRGNLPKQVTDILRMWFQDHVAHPYPTEEEKQQLMHQTGLTISQISNWFINARRRSLPRMQGQGQTDADLN